MRLHTIIAQFPVAMTVDENLTQVLAIVRQCSPGSLVVLPEGALSGYSDDLSFLDHLDLGELAQSLQVLQEAVVQQGIHLFVGSCLRPDGQWRNAALYFSPQGHRLPYYKVNLATHERGRFAAGSALCIMRLNLGGAILRVGIQLCREILFPNQWHILAEAGADVIVFMMHGIADPIRRAVWKSHLISRAAEIQRYVLAVNTAHPAQLCPTMLVDPQGSVVQEEASEQTVLLCNTIDTAKNSNWYLSQQRRDLTAVEYPEPSSGHSAG